MGNAPPASHDTPAGRVATAAAGASTLAAHVPWRRSGSGCVITASPSRSSVTPGPVAATVPAASVPSAIGAGPPTCQSPTLTRSSQLPIPAAVTSMRTSPAAGIAGSSTSKISTGSPSAVIPAARICSAARYWRRWCRAGRSAPLKGRGQELRVLALRRVAVRVDDQVLVAVVRGLERHTGVDADEPTCRHVNPLWRLADVQRERAGEDDECLFLRRMTVPASRRPGLVSPDIPAHVREVRAVAQLGDVPSRLARLVRTREPLELVRPDHVIGHRAS